MRLFLNTITLATVSAIVVACGGQPSDSAATSQDSSALKAELQDQFNAYAQALVDRDIDLVTTLTSTEIHNRANSMGMGMSAFADKMRNSMLTEFNTMSDGTSLGNPFTIESVQLEGDAAKVEISRAGQKLAKPLYFVKEDGTYKLNLQRPGFSNPVTAGAGASLDNYRLRNENGYQIAVRCASGSGYLKAYGEGYFFCDTKCGFFSGSRFYSPIEGNTNSVKCDWNTWGVDVYYRGDYPNGLRCNDKC